jgi:hypothetical protein
VGVRGSGVWRLLCHGRELAAAAGTRPQGTRAEEQQYWHCVVRVRQRGPIRLGGCACLVTRLGHNIPQPQPPD